MQGLAAQFAIRNVKVDQEVKANRFGVIVQVSNQHVQGGATLGRADQLRREPLLLYHRIPSTQHEHALLRGAKYFSCWRWCSVQ